MNKKMDKISILTLHFCVPNIVMFWLRAKHGLIALASYQTWPNCFNLAASFSWLRTKIIFGFYIKELSFLVISKLFYY